MKSSSVTESLVEDELNDEEFENLKQYQMRDEKYVASNVLHAAFRKQFTIKETVCDKLSALKKGLVSG